MAGRRAQVQALLEHQFLFFLTANGNDDSSFPLFTTLPQIRLISLGHWKERREERNSPLPLLCETMIDSCLGSA